MIMFLCCPNKLMRNAGWEAETRGAGVVAGEAVIAGKREK